MAAEREEMRQKQKERESIPQAIRDAKWAAFAEEIEADEPAPAEGDSCCVRSIASWVTRVVQPLPGISGR